MVVILIAMLLVAIHMNVVRWQRDKDRKGDRDTGAHAVGFAVGQSVTALRLPPRDCCHILVTNVAAE